MRQAFTIAFALAVSVLLALIATRALADAPPAPAYQVIVNPANKLTELDRSFLEDAYLKRVSHWPSDQMIRPVDLVASSPTRRAFSEAVIRRSIDAVKGYWQQRIFSGRDVPPPELDADEDVVKYVLKYEGGVGYVSRGANLNGAKVVAVR
jgi:ABC-type phosphate transport system substrate-binding protein